MGYIKDDIKVEYRRGMNMYGYTKAELSLYNYIYTEAYKKINLDITSSIATASYLGSTLPVPFTGSFISSSFISSSGFIQIITDRSYDGSLINTGSTSVLSLKNYVLNKVNTSSLDAKAQTLFYQDWHVYGKFTGSLTLGQEYALEELVFVLIMEYYNDTSVSTNRFIDYGL
jgi:hypothetical protein